MNIAVLSGKGGAGKTLVSVNLSEVSENSTYIDCDVEEPNGHLFFKPDNIIKNNISVKIPIVNNDLCEGCRTCVDFCKFNALAYTDKLLIFDDICHSCGGCMRFCPNGALSEKEKVIGEVQKGVSNGIDVISGILNIGEPSGVPIIKELLNHIDENSHYNIIDCPPGSACVVMESIKDADYCILVSEPTVFGAHNLNMVYELVKLFNKPHGVVINKYINEDNPTEKLCKEKNIKILDRIPFDKELGNLNSDGVIISREKDEYREVFESLLNTVTKEVKYEAITNP
ncbi:ATP-binding protein [Clostridium sp. D2Q-11]|uniref:ATP-binding protein n=1 Tax=Anaeromonas frigoriresistens TaxID=2683708 RepID=A0A942V2I7_9FIRM|nr:ATP-binding protein [Anaeromonas frigoriresistens]MBS4538787.1 ATP-binding protein [Anaeromonas frigoriresistens]